MQKQAVIFADQPTDEKDNKTSNPKKITLSRDEYRDVVKQAYQEGIEDAKQENGQQDKEETNQSSRSNIPDQRSNNKGGYAPSSEQEQKPGEKKLQKEGQEEAVKKHEQKKAEIKQKFENIKSRHEIKLLETKTLFPFSIFPDTLVIDTTKVTVVRKKLFATEFITTIPLKDVSDVTVQTALFMGSVTFKYMPQSNSPGMLEPVSITMSSLKREDAIKAKNILKGVLVANSEDIDIAELTPEEVADVVEKFGSSEGVE